MDIRLRLEEFAGRFVLASFRERFVHEALKKPTKLHERICHQIDDVFPTRYRGGSLPFKAGDSVFPIIGTDRDCVDECKWEDIADREATGYGFLVASHDLIHFYAETESELGFPYKTYSDH
ncbi:MAG: hypothetical protein AAF226_10080 [Verrucomicrobiota bacterium]